MKLANVPTKILLSELVLRGVIADKHIVRVSNEEIEVVHPPLCLVEDNLAACVYALAMMVAIENMTANNIGLPINAAGSYYVDLEDGKLVDWRLI